MTIYRDELFHNQVQEGVELIVKDDFCCMTDHGLVDIDKGMQVVITDVVPVGSDIAVRVDGEFQMGTTIDSIVELFDRVVPLHEVEFNPYATPLHIEIN